jgi:hypothetical protein
MLYGILPVGQVVNRARENLVLLAKLRGVVLRQSYQRGKARPISWRPPSALPSSTMMARSGRKHLYPFRRRCA